MIELSKKEPLPPRAPICELCGSEPGVEYIELLAEGKTAKSIEGGGFHHEIHSKFGRTLGAKCLEAQRRDGNID